MSWEDMYIMANMVPATILGYVTAYMAVRGRGVYENMQGRGWQASILAAAATGALLTATSTGMEMHFDNNPVSVEPIKIDARAVGNELPPLEEIAAPPIPEPLLEAA